CDMTRVHVPCMGNDSTARRNIRSNLSQVTDEIRLKSHLVGRIESPSHRGLSQHEASWATPRWRRSGLATFGRLIALLGTDDNVLHDSSAFIHDVHLDLAELPIFVGIGRLITHAVLVSQFDAHLLQDAWILSSESRKPSAPEAKVFSWLSAWR